MVNADDEILQINRTHSLTLSAPNAGRQMLNAMAQRCKRRRAQCGAAVDRRMQDATCRYFHLLLLFSCIDRFALAIY